MFLQKFLTFPVHIHLEEKGDFKQKQIALYCNLWAYDTTDMSVKE